MRRPGIYVPLSAHYADDEKIMEVGEDAELMYVRMLAYAARTPGTGGWISAAVAMSRLGITERPEIPGSDPGSRLGKLTGIGLILREGSGWRIAAWHRWNRSPEQIDRERAQDRTRKSRANTGKSTGTAPGNSTGVQGAFLGADTDTDTDTEGERSKRRKPSLPIPDDWKPNSGHEAYAVEHGIDLSTEAFKFRNHAISKDRRQADWDAAFRNWLASGFVVKAAPPQPESRNIARLPKCPTCNAPQEVIHYDDCTDQAWRPTA